MLYRCSLVAFNMRSQHVVPVLGVVNHEEYHGFCIVLPWMENGNVRNYRGRLVSQYGLSGRNLVDRVNHWVRSDFVQLQRLIRDTSKLLCVAEGLSYLHSFGVVHGDVRGVSLLDTGSDHLLTQLRPTSLWILTNTLG